MSIVRMIKLSRLGYEVATRSRPRAPRPARRTQTAREREHSDATLVCRAVPRRVREPRAEDERSVARSVRPDRGPTATTGPDVGPRWTRDAVARRPGAGAEPASV